MRSFFAELVRRAGETVTLLVMDEEGVDPPRRYRVRPQRVLMLWGGSLLIAALLAVGFVAWTPVRAWIPGYGTQEMQQKARLNAMRVAALADSMRAQQEYIQHLQGLITGEMDSTLIAAKSGGASPEGPSEAPVEDDEAAVEAPADEWPDHAQPALPVARSSGESVAQASSLAGHLQLPMLPPVQGVPTRGFDARAGHYAIDIAAEEGSSVRSIGDGYVIVADWTQDGGYTIAVHHAGGYVSVYKHNKRLLKRIGDRVRDREAIAISGNTGEVTTGPHLHFELWRDGLAQNPQAYVVGW